MPRTSEALRLLGAKLHVGDNGAKRGIFGSGSIRKGEIAADNYAVELMANGGYQPKAGIAFLR